jgi:CheY-like chemotaxis protein
VQSLKKLVADDPKGLRAAEAIELAAKRGATLTRQLLTFARRQTVHPTTAAVSERIDAFRTMLASTIGGSVTLLSEVAPDTWPIHVDPSEFELALVNLALNARDAMPQGGMITLSAENVRLRAPDTPARLEGDFVALTVADTGCGIAPDILPRVFDPFFTTKETSKGSGLGLSQVHGFAHQSGGTVTIKSELGRGTSVTMYLPRARAERLSGAAESECHDVASGVALVVEDNPDVAEVTRQLIEQLGYTVQTAENAQAALALAERVPFQIVISDIVMAGGIDGIALAKTLRQRRPDLPIVLVTGYSSSASAAEAEFSVLRKPFLLSELSRAMAKAIAETHAPSTDNVVRLHDASRGDPKRHDPA